MRTMRVLLTPFELLLFRRLVGDHAGALACSLLGHDRQEHRWNSMAWPMKNEANDLVHRTAPLPRNTSTQRVAPAVFPSVCRSFQVASSGRLPIQILQALTC